MEVKFLSVSEQELEETVAYYNRERQGLGFEFASEVQRTLQRITAYPKAWHPLSPRTRRCRTNRFPYGLIYQIRGDHILIVGVMHLKRKPDSWKSRIE